MSSCATSGRSPTVYPRKPRSLSYKRFPEADNVKVTPNMTYYIDVSPLPDASGRGRGWGRFSDELLRDKRALSDRVSAETKIFIVQALSGG